MKITRKWTLVHVTNDNEVLDEVTQRSGTKMTKRVLDRVDKMRQQALENSEYRVVYKETYE